MTEGVQVKVRSSLSKIIEELEKIRESAGHVGDELKNAGKQVGDGLNDQTKKTETFLSNLTNLSRRAADQMKRDFKSLASINAIAGSLKLSNQFAGSIKETADLNDTIRKFGRTLGVTSADFRKFQTMLTEGLGEIGMSSEVATKALQGLVETPVRGQENLLEYSKTAGMLASISGSKGSEGDIAKGLVSVIQARGGNVNDPNEMRKVAEDLRKVFVQTGAKPSDTLAEMQSIFANMPKDLRKAISTSGLTNLATVAAVGGPNATKFLEEYLGKSPIARKAFEAQGGAGVFTNKGLDTEKFAKFAQSITKRVGGDPRLAAQTLGLSEEAAEGFVRLAENLDKVKDAQDRVSKTTGDLNEQYRSSMGLGEAFRANINRIKKLFAAPLSFVTQKGTDLLSGASQSNLGAGAVVGGAGALAALLASFGLKGVGKGLGGAAGGLAKAVGIESLTGKEVQPVYVVNASEIGQGGLFGGLGEAVGGAGAAAAGGGVLGMLLKGGLIGAAAGAIGYGIKSMFDPNDVNAQNAIRSGDKFDRMNQAYMGSGSAPQPYKVQVDVHTTTPNLKATKREKRGGSY